MILRLGLKNIDFLGKMKVEKLTSLIHRKALGGYVPNRERNLSVQCDFFKTSHEIKSNFD